MTTADLALLSRPVYYIIGNAVRTNLQSDGSHVIQQLLDNTEHHSRYRFHLLRQRSLALINAPETLQLQRLVRRFIGSRKL